MRNNIFSLIRTKYNTLSESQKIVANYVLNNPSLVMHNTLNELATACGVSETTVLRFLHKIDYQSYQIFKISLTQGISQGKEEIPYEDIRFGDSVDQIINKVTSSIINSIRDSREIINPKEIESVAERIINANEILVIGVGASGYIAADLYHKLIKLGFHVVHSNDPHIINILSSNLTKEDLCIAVSHTGESHEILDGATIAKEQNCDVIAITSFEKSTLANQAQHIICSSSIETKFRSDAMASRIIQLAIVDMIYISIIVEIGEKILPQIHKSRIVVSKNKT